MDQIKHKSLNVFLRGFFILNIILRAKNYYFVNYFCRIMPRSVKILLLSFWTVIVLKLLTTLILNEKKTNLIKFTGCKIK